MPSHRYRPQQNKILKSKHVKNLLDFRNSRIRNHKTYDFSTKPECQLSPNEWYKLRIDKIYQETHDSKRFTLELPKNIDELNLPISNHFKVRGYNLFNNNEVIKKYTPVSDSLFDGYIEFVIKYYKNGSLTPYLFELNENDTMEINGPYLSDLQYPFAHKSNIGMIAGGTGIAPMVQILKEMALHTQYDTRYVDLLYANKTSDDYLCQGDLMSLKVIMKDRLNIYDFYEFDKHKNILLPNSWNTNVPKIGRIDIESMKTFLPKPHNDTLIILCGLPQMIELFYGPRTDNGRELNGYLEQLGYTKDMIHVF
eukprot:287390_1